MHSDQSLRCPHKETLHPWVSKWTNSDQIARMRSQSDLILCWVHMSEGTFSDLLAPYIIFLFIYFTVRYCLLMSNTRRNSACRNMRRLCSQSEKGLCYWLMCYTVADKYITCFKLDCAKHSVCSGPVLSIYIRRGIARSLLHKPLGKYKGKISRKCHKHEAQPYRGTERRRDEDHLIVWFY